MNLQPFRLERFFARHEFAVDYVLCASDCEALAVGDLLALEPDAAGRFHAHWLGYTEAPGNLTLRSAIAGIYATIAPEEVLVHSGAQEAIFLFMQAALQPGDHVIVHWPCYQSLAEVARALGCDVTPWVARVENGWALDLDELVRLLRPSTRAIVVNLPHNPTGSLMPAAEFQRLHDLAQEQGILLFGDEVYRESEHDPAARLPAACDLGDHAVSLGVMSKTYGLAGLRIGWIATHNSALLERMAALKDYTTICASAPSEFLAELALRHRQTLIERNVGRIRRNLDVLDGFFGRHADRFVWRRPLAGPIAFPQLLGEEVAAFCDRLVTQTGVLLLPGTVYDHPGNHFRIGFGRENCGEAVERLESFLRA